MERSQLGMARPHLPFEKPCVPAGRTGMKPGFEPDWNQRPGAERVGARGFSGWLNWVSVGPGHPLARNPQVSPDLAVSQVGLGVLEKRLLTQAKARGAPTAWVSAPPPPLSLLPLPIPSPAGPPASSAGPIHSQSPSASWRKGEASRPPGWRCWPLASPASLPTTPSTGPPSPPALSLWQAKC